MPVAPLPIWGTWATGNVPAEGGSLPGPTYVTSLIDGGSHGMPTFILDPTYSWSQVEAAFAVQIATCASNRLPLILRQNDLFDNIAQYSPWDAESVDPAAPSAHGWHIYYNSSTLAWTTKTDRLSPWSEVAIKYAYDYGKFFANCPTMRNLMRIYPRPELVICLDNNGSGFDWGDIANSNGLDRRMIETGDWGGLAFDNLVDFIDNDTSGTRAISLGTETLYYFKTTFYKEAEIQIKAAFNRGFIERLYELNHYWAENIFWMDLAGRNPDMWASRVTSGTVGSDFATNYLSAMREDLQAGFTPGGRTSRCYRDTADAGAENRKARLWYLASNERTSRDRSRMLGEHRGNGKGFNLSLYYEGDTKPTAAEWTGWARHSLWLHQCGISASWNLALHYLDDAELIGGDNEAIYAQGFQAVVDEIYNDATLSYYMTQGDVVPSLEGLPRMDLYWWPGHETLPYYLQHVASNGRYEATQQANFELITSAEDARAYLQSLRSPEDNERESTTAAVNLETVVTAYRVPGNDKILLFAVGPGSTQTSVTARIPLWDLDTIVDFVVPSAPVTGTFWEFDLDGTNATEILT